MRYFIGFFVTIILLILLIVLLVSSGGPKAPKVTPKELSSYSNTSATTEISIFGPVNAQSLHAGVIITVGRDQVVYQQITGYDNQVVKMTSYANTENSYYAFLRALNTARFTQGNRDTKLSNEQGLCPLGQRYTFVINQDNEQIQKFWSTSCGKGTYAGNTNLTLTLFQAQVPDYNTLVQSVHLN